MTNALRCLTAYCPALIVLILFTWIILLLGGLADAHDRAGRTRSGKG